MQTYEKMVVLSSCDLHSCGLRSSDHHLHKSTSRPAARRRDRQLNQLQAGYRTSTSTSTSASSHPLWLVRRAGRFSQPPPILISLPLGCASTSLSLLYHLCEHVFLECTVYTDSSASTSIRVLSFRTRIATTQSSLVVCELEHDLGHGRALLPFGGAHRFNFTLPTRATSAELLHVCLRRLGGPSAARALARTAPPVCEHQVRSSTNLSHRMFLFVNHDSLWWHRAVSKHSSEQCMLLHAHRDSLSLGREREVYFRGRPSSLQIGGSSLRAAVTPRTATEREPLRNRCLS